MDGGEPTKPPQADTAVCGATWIASPPLHGTPFREELALSRSAGAPSGAEYRPTAVEQPASTGQQNPDSGAGLVQYEPKRTRATMHAVRVLSTDRNVRAGHADYR